ncbi:hypothetical protein PGTUg99_024678 [Puccinia graminis f. sp. tritici]|uniref:Uncharacterized protein n=1 Tax=Puccinia graminis f. sp. tritici TaxID=56615 RepID=A0A5B0QVR8_PUCGR|nr:hypothetical protein PGTUg99_024678 [Puccinia graminis f. sp. tritici]
MSTTFNTPKYKRLRYYSVKHHDTIDNSRDLSLLSRMYGGYEARIRHLEGIVHLLLARTDPLLSPLKYSAPLAGSFRYSIKRGLEPILSGETTALLSKTTATSLATDRQRRCPITSNIQPRQQTSEAARGPPIMRTCPSINQSSSLDSAKSFSPAQLPSRSSTSSKFLISPSLSEAKLPPLQSTVKLPSPRSRPFVTCDSSTYLARKFEQVLKPTRPSLPRIPLKYHPSRSLSLDRFAFSNRSLSSTQASKTPESPPCSQDRAVVTRSVSPHSARPPSPVCLPTRPPTPSMAIHSINATAVGPKIAATAQEPTVTPQLLDPPTQASSNSASRPLSPWPSPPWIDSQNDPASDSLVVLRQDPSSTTEANSRPDRSSVLPPPSLPLSTETAVNTSLFSAAAKDHTLSIIPTVHQPNTPAHSPVNAIIIVADDLLPTSIPANPAAISAIDNTSNRTPPLSSTSPPDQTATTPFQTTIPVSTLQPVPLECQARPTMPYCSFPTAKACHDSFDIATIGSITVMEDSTVSKDPHSWAPGLSQAALENYKDIDDYLKTLEADETEMKKKKKKKKKKKTPGTTSIPDNPVRGDSEIFLSCLAPFRQTVKDSTESLHPCAQLPLTPDLWQSLDLDNYLKSFPDGERLSLELFAEKAGATNFECGIGKICDANQICFPVRGRDWYILVAAQNWNSFSNEMYRAMTFALSIVGGLASSIVNDYAPKEPDIIMIDQQFWGILGGTGLAANLLNTYHNVIATLPTDESSKVSTNSYRKRRHECWQKLTTREVKI